MAVSLPRPGGWVGELSKRPVVRNAASLFGATMVTSVLGFAFSVAAARLFPVAEVGIAFPALSAMQLLAQFGLVGIGMMLIGRLSGGDFEAGLVSAGAVTATATAFLLGIGFELLEHEHVFSTHLGPLGRGVFGPLLFAAGTAITSGTLILDQATIGLGHGRIQLVRNGVFALVKLLLLPVGLLLPWPGAVAIYVAWAAGNVISLWPYYREARRARITPVLRPDFRALHGQRWVAFAHNWLNMADQAPRMLMPVLVAGVLSRTDAAAFYAAALLVTFPTIIPVHLTTALFALPRGELDRLADEARTTLRLSLAIGVLGAVGSAALAYPLLLMFGKHYTVAAASMAVLGLNILPFAIKVHYGSIERVRDRLARCAVVSTVGAALEIALSIVGVEKWGMVGLSAGLVVALVIEAILLWPVVARVIQVPVWGLPRWLWRTDFQPTPAPHRTSTFMVSSGRGEDLRPYDPILIRAWLFKHLGETGSRRVRLRSAFGIAQIAWSLFRRRADIYRAQITLSQGPAGRAIDSLVSVRIGAFTAPRVSMFVLDLSGRADNVASVAPASDPLDAVPLGELSLARLLDSRVAIAAYSLCRGQSPTEFDEQAQRFRDLHVLPEAITIAALDAKRRFVGVGTVVTDGREAVLVSLVAQTHHPDEDRAVAVVHEALVECLLDHEVLRLWSPGAFETDPRRQRFQRQVGYRAAMLRTGEDDPKHR
jgi:O-antigen/teichoic acid export membrane protein